MKLAKSVVVVVITLLSFAAGIPKVLQAPQELAFLEAIGLDALSVTLLGIAQLAGGVLLVFRKTRIAGSVVAATTFLVSTIAIFLSGNTAFGFFSVLPILLAGIVGFDSLNMKAGKDESRLE